MGSLSLFIARPLGALSTVRDRFAPLDLSHHEYLRVPASSPSRPSIVAVSVLDTFHTDLHPQYLMICQTTTGQVSLTAI
jgi:hypothetical protein